MIYAVHGVFYNLNEQFFLAALSLTFLATFSQLIKLVCSMHIEYLVPVFYFSFSFDFLLPLLKP